VTFDIEKVVKEVNNYNPFAMVNYDPGKYLCNFAMCMSYGTFGREDNCDNFFLHIPDGFDDFQ